MPLPQAAGFKTCLGLRFPFHLPEYEPRICAARQCRAKLLYVGQPVSFYSQAIRFLSRQSAANVAAAIQAAGYCERDSHDRNCLAVPETRPCSFIVLFRSWGATPLQDGGSWAGVGLVPHRHLRVPEARSSSVPTERTFHHGDVGGRALSR